MDLELVTLEQYAPLPEGQSQYSLDFIRTWSVVKLKEDGDEVIVGSSEPERAEVFEQLARFHRKAVRPVRIEASEFAAYCGRFGADTKKDSALPSSEIDERLMLDRIANDAPVVNLVNSILIDAVRLGASDIHIEGFADHLAIRYRLDGVLRNYAQYPAGRFAAISSRIKIMANLNIMERRLPQDGRITVAMGGSTVDMRVSIIPIAKGESIVLRIFRSAAQPLSLEELGFSALCVAQARSFYKIPHGLVLVTGPTGSGKTTTLNAMIKEINSEDLKIITIEDPIECLVEGVSQVQTNEQINLNFDTILQRVLRQDPNVIMVGEIRDSLTAELAIRAALTGHLVLSTLHTNDSVSTIVRLHNMGIEPYLIASTLKGAIAQRLVRRLCPECASKRKATKAEQALFARYGEPSIRELGEPTGCKSCGGTGYRGRIAIGEFMPMNEALEELILGSASTSELRASALEHGMISLQQDGLAKAKALATSISEIEREVGL